MIYILICCEFSQRQFHTNANWRTLPIRPHIADVFEKNKENAHIVIIAAKKNCLALISIKFI